MKINTIVKTVYLILLVAVLAGCSQNRKVGIVNIHEVFEDFDYTKELKKELESITVKQKNILDSLRLDLNVLLSKMQAGEPVSEEVVQTKQKEYYQLQESFHSSSQELTQSYDQQIINQMNSYIDEYGQANNFDLIIGKNEAGNVMYFKEEMDITKDVVEYLNVKFKGGD